jgi:hypothetical protein
MEKNILTESFYITTKLDDVSLIDIQLIKNHILEQYNLNKNYSDLQYWYMNNYVQVPYHKHIQWLSDWITDHYKLNHNKTLCFTLEDGIRGLVQKPNQIVNTHHNVKDWHLLNSPEIDCIFTLTDCDESESHLVLEYDDGRNKHRRWKVPLKKNQVILFSSHLNRYITNESKDLMVNLSLHFNLI